MEEDPRRFREQLFEVGLHGVGVLLGAKAEPPGQAANVGVHSDGRAAEGVRQHDIGRLGSDPGQLREGGEVRRHLATVALHQELGGPHDVLRLGFVEADAPNQYAHRCRICPRQIFGCRVAGKESRAGGVHAHVGRLSRQHGRDEKFEGGGVAELGRRTGVEIFEAIHRFGRSGAAVPFRFLGHLPIVAAHRQRRRFPR